MRAIVGVGLSAVWAGRCHGYRAGGSRLASWLLVVGLVPVVPDVGGVQTEGDGGPVGLGVGESSVMPAPHGAGGDADLAGEVGDGWVAGGGEEWGERPADLG